jgi:hypothetical protein
MVLYLRPVLTYSICSHGTTTSSDLFASEIAWALIAGETGEIVASRPYGFYRYENEVREIVQLIPGKYYTFTINDFYGDGIASKGYYQILSAGGAVLVHADGMFGGQAVHQFRAPHVP